VALIAGMRTNFKILLISLLRFLERRLNLIWRVWKTERKEEKDVTSPTHEPDNVLHAKESAETGGSVRACTVQKRREEWVVLIYIRHSGEKIFRNSNDVSSTSHYFSLNHRDN
jgi:hypothetical protein